MCAAKKQRWGQSWGRRGVGERGLYKWGVGVILVGVHQIIRIILIYYYVNVKLIDRCVKLKSLSPLFCVWIWKTEDFYYRKQMVNSAFLVFLTNVCFQYKLHSCICVVMYYCLLCYSYTHKFTTGVWIQFTFIYITPNAHIHAQWTNRDHFQYLKHLLWELSIIWNLEVAEVINMWEIKSIMIKISKKLQFRNEFGINA